MSNILLQNIRLRVEDEIKDAAITTVHRGSMERDEFIDGLSKINMSWAPLPNSNSTIPDEIVLIYPYTISQGSNIVPVDQIKYKIKDLSKAIHVIGAILGWYNQDYIGVEVPGVTQAFRLYHSTYITRVKRYQLLHNQNSFKGLEMIEPGVYVVLLSY